MSTSDYLLSVGVNTGNSLDAADVVLTRFGLDGSILDLQALSVPMPDRMADDLRLLRSAVVEEHGDMERALSLYEERASASASLSPSGADLIRSYTLYVAEAVRQLIATASSRPDSEAGPDIIGFHGQTCAHQPPSIARDLETTCTVQIGDGQLLADQIGIPVVFDFRSDDLMNGGEAAPLAPVHHEHLARHLKSRGFFPIAFCNAGNTGNISVISERPDASLFVSGWDVGPFNDYPDKLVQSERGQKCDRDGEIGARGQVDLDLLRLLFEKSAITENGNNFLLQPPPKSSDPQWYRLLPELCGERPIGATVLSFADRLRTAEYFAAYVYYFSLKWIPPEVEMPTCFALCGGGWNNPLCRSDFERLLHGQFESLMVLPEHKDLFAQILQRLQVGNRAVALALADQFGFSGQYMEARLFADAAVCRITGTPFSRPETTGCRAPTILGIIRFPHGRLDLASDRLKLWLSKYGSLNLTCDDASVFDGRYSRASSGWHARKLKLGETV